MCSSSVMQVCKKKVILKWKKITSMHLQLSPKKGKLEAPLRLKTSLKTSNTEMLFTYLYHFHVQTHEFLH